MFYIKKVSLSLILPSLFLLLACSNFETGKGKAVNKEGEIVGIAPIDDGGPPSVAPGNGSNGGTGGSSGDNTGDSSDPNSNGGGTSANGSGSGDDTENQIVLTPMEQFANRYNSWTIGPTQFILESYGVDAETIARLSDVSDVDDSPTDTTPPDDTGTDETPPAQDTDAEFFDVVSENDGIDLDDLPSFEFISESPTDETESGGTTDGSTPVDFFDAEIQICLNAVHRVTWSTTYDYYPAYFHVRAIESKAAHDSHDGKWSGIQTELKFSLDGVGEGIMFLNSGEALKQTSSPKRASQTGDQYAYVIDKKTSVGWSGLTPWNNAYRGLHHPESHLEYGSNKVKFSNLSESIKSNIQAAKINILQSAAGSSYWPPENRTRYTIEGRIKSVSKNLASFKYEGTFPIIPSSISPYAETSSSSNPWDWSCDGHLVRVKTAPYDKPVQTVIISRPEADENIPPSEETIMARLYQKGCPLFLYNYVRDDFQEHHGLFVTDVTADACSAVPNYAFSDGRPDYIHLEERLREGKELGFQPAGKTLMEACFTDNDDPLTKDNALYKKAFIGEFFSALKRFTEGYRLAMENLAHLKQLASISCDVDDIENFGWSQASTLLPDGETCESYAHIPGGKSWCEKFKNACTDAIDYNHILQEIEFAYSLWETYRDVKDENTNLNPLVADDTIDPVLASKMQGLMLILEDMHPFIGQLEFQSAVSQEMQTCLNAHSGNVAICESLHKTKAVCEGVKAQASLAASRMTELMHGYRDALKCVTSRDGNGCTEEFYEETLKQAPPITDVFKGPQNPQDDVQAHMRALLATEHLIDFPYCRHEFRGYLDEANENAKFLAMGTITSLAILGVGPLVGGAYRLWSSAAYSAKSAGHAAESAKIAAHFSHRATEVLEAALVGKIMFHIAETLPPEVKACDGMIEKVRNLPVSAPLEPSCPQGPIGSEYQGPQIVNHYRGCVLKALAWSSLDLLEFLRVRFIKYYSHYLNEKIRSALNWDAQHRLPVNLAKKAQALYHQLEKGPLSAEDRQAYVTGLKQIGLTSEQAQNLVLKISEKFTP